MPTHGPWWTAVSSLRAARNEGVSGSSPLIGSKNPCFAGVFIFRLFTYSRSPEIYLQVGNFGGVRFRVGSLAAA